MLKTDKSTLSKQLTSQIDSENPDKIDIEIIDGFYYMYQIGATLPQTFGKLAESILIKLCAKKAKEVHIVLDRYLKPSIKDCERQNREGNIHRFPTMKICLANGASKRGNKDEICINYSKLSKKLGPTLCHALPAFHAFTGSDYTAAFFNKGKFSAENNGWLIFDGSLKPTWFLGNATPLEVENIILGDSQDDSADNEEDSDVCSDEVDSSDDSESSLESDYE
ncbi:hypothetical protein EVAR_80124_1 [Eumeta japonica]|uniref:Uncharacterized protein n=1 Tax=Eumeta variegata TaxID=151549 RepID=A0A4C1UCU9_EUMVA|nr:hypothetical protein EVAR_80124_1 [Eumeta japonica]